MNPNCYAPVTASKNCNIPVNFDPNGCSPSVRIRRNWIAQRQWVAQRHWIAENKTLIGLLMLLLVFGSRSFAQDKEEKAVTDVVESLRKTMVDPDKAILDQLIADDLSYGHSSGVVQTKAEFMDALTSGKSDFVSIELSQQTVKVVGNTALVRHILSGTTNDGGKPGTVKLSILLVWQKQKGQWRLLARQAVKIL